MGIKISMGMEDRDKRRVIRVITIGEPHTLRGSSINIADMNMGIYGCMDPDMEMLRGVSKELWEAAIPRYNSMVAKSAGVPIVFGTGSDMSGVEYFQHMWENAERPHVTNFEGLDDNEFFKCAKYDRNK